MDLGNLDGFRVYTTVVTFDGVDQANLVPKLLGHMTFTEAADFTSYSFKLFF